MHELDPKESRVVFNGSTKLPLTDNVDDIMVAIIHWAACLSDIRRVILNALWNVHVEGSDLIWDEGWQLPMD